VSFATITLCVASQRLLIVYFIIDSVRKLLDTPSYPYSYSLQRGITFEVLPLSSCALSPTMLPLLETFLQLWATGWTIGVLGFDSQRGLGIFLFTTVSRTALGPTQPPVQWTIGALSRGVKRPGREADHSPPSSAEVKE
jgi:hypothetical protein